MKTDLVILAQRGDKGAFGLIAAGIADRFLAVSRRILRDIDLAEDATQQALLAISQELPRLRDPARFDAWSYRLLVHACYAEGRKERRWAPNLRLMSGDEPIADDSLSSVVDREQLERGFRRPSIDHRAVVVLYHYLDMPLDGIAETLDIPVGTAHSRLHHAMRGLRAALDEQVNSETTAALDVTIGSYSGKRLVIRPADSVSCEDLVWWVGTDAPGRGATVDEPIPDTVYVLNVDGERIVIVAYPVGPDAVLTEVIESMEFTRT